MLVDGFKLCVGAKEKDSEKTLENLKMKLVGSVSLSTSAFAESKYRWEPAFAISNEFAYVGSAKAPRPHALKVTEIPPDLLGVLHEYPEIERLRYPKRTPEETMESLVKTCSVGQAGGFVPYLPFEEEFVVEQMLYDEPGPDAPLWAREFRLPTPREVLGVVAQLSDESNAGYPYCLYSGPKRSVALANFGATYRAVCDRLLLLATADEVPLDPVALVRQGFCDPVLAVEKDEPYDPGKKTCRTIIMGSLVDEIIDRLYTDSHDEFELANFGRFRSACGIGFTKDHLDFLVECVEDMEADARRVCPELDPREPLAKNDIKGFDTNEFEEDALTEAEVVCRRYGLPPAGRDDELPWHRFLRRVVFNRTKCTFRSVFVFGDGTLWAQLTRGIQKSGTKRTTSRNTNVRGQKHLRCAFRYHVAKDLALGTFAPNQQIIMLALLSAAACGYDPRNAAWWRLNHPSLGVGDDKLEPNYPGLVQNYEETNVRIKPGSFGTCSSNEFEFCSHVWKRGASAPRPLNAAKSAFRLLCGEPTPQKYIQWATTYWHASDRDRYVHLFRRLGYPVGKRTQPEP